MVQARITRSGYHSPITKISGPVERHSTRREKKIVCTEPPSVHTPQSRYAKKFLQEKHGMALHGMVCNIRMCARLFWMQLQACAAPSAHNFHFMHFFAVFDFPYKRPECTLVLFQMVFRRCSAKMRYKFLVLLVVSCVFICNQTNCPENNWIY